MFFSKESYDFDLAIAKEYLEEDMNQTAVLYQVDASSTNVNTTYGETKEGGVRYKTPVEFHCIYEIEEPELKAYDTFICKLCEMARNQKRVSAKEKEVDNEKYAFRCFLLRLGFIGAEFKTERKILLRNLAGSSAFKSGSGKEAANDAVSE